MLSRKTLLIISLIIVLIDQSTKLMVVYLLKSQQYIEIIPNILNINLTNNYGAAFSILSNSTNLLRTISLFASVLFTLLIISRSYKNKLDQFSLALLLAGSLGNGIDRWINGYVIDFIQIPIFNFPVFNIADIVINVGIALIIMEFIFKKK